MKRWFIPFLVLVFVVLGGVLRFYRLDHNPPSLSWDEAAVGYNAFTIANWSRDEWGVRFPLVFESFEDYKHPVHIYVTALFVKLFGISDFVVRLPTAFLGVMNIILIYLVGATVFKKKLVGLFSAGAMAFSPYAIQFSRFNHELNFVLFFFLLGTYFFYLGIEKNKKILPFAFLSFGLTLLTYHSAKVVVPPLVLCLVWLYRKELLVDKTRFLVNLTPLLFSILVIVVTPQLLGLARAKQTSFSRVEVEKTSFFQITHSQLLGQLEIVGKQYVWHFLPKFLFLTGDKNSRHSTQIVGEFYKTEIPFIVIGLVLVVYQAVARKRRKALLLLLWVLISPLPSALVNEAPHAARAMFMLPSLILLFGSKESWWLLYCFWWR